MFFEKHILSFSKSTCCEEFERTVCSIWCYLFYNVLWHIFNYLFLSLIWGIFFDCIETKKRSTKQDISDVTLTLIYFSDFLKAQISPLFEFRKLHYNIFIESVLKYFSWMLEVKSAIWFWNKLFMLFGFLMYFLIIFMSLIWVDGKPISIYFFSATGLHFVNRDRSNVHGFWFNFWECDLIGYNGLIMCYQCRVNSLIQMI